METPNLTAAQLQQLASASTDADPKAPNEMWLPERLWKAVVRLVEENPDAAQKEYALKLLSKESRYTRKVLEEYYGEVEIKLGVKHGSPQRDKPAIDPSTAFTPAQRARGETWQSCTNLFAEFPALVDNLDYITYSWLTHALLIVIGLTLIAKERLICFWGTTGDGKTGAAELLLKLVDFDMALGRIHKVMDCSPEWIKYAGGPDGDQLAGRILFMDEMNPAKPGQDDRRQELIRQLDNDDTREAVFEIVDKLENGQIGIRQHRLKMPLYVLITSITPPQRWDAQNRSRFIYVEFNIAPEQVTEAKRRIAQPTSTADEREDHFKAFNCFLFGLRRQDKEAAEAFFDVEIPFLNELVVHQPDGTGADIRRFKLMRGMIQSSAILHQQNRKIKRLPNGREVLIAEMQDYDNIREAFERIVPRTTLPAGERYLSSLRKFAAWLYLHPTQDREEISRQSGVKLRTLESDLPDLVDADLLQSVTVDGSRRKFYQIGSRIQKHMPRQEMLGISSEAEFQAALEKAIREIREMNSATATLHDAAEVGVGTGQGDRVGISDTPVIPHGESDQVDVRDVF